MRVSNIGGISWLWIVIEKGGEHLLRASAVSLLRYCYYVQPILKILEDNHGSFVEKISNLTRVFRRSSHTTFSSPYIHGKSGLR